MPIYEFLCKECRYEFKTLRRADRADDVSCPTCGGQKVSRLLSVTATTSSAAQDQGSCNLPMGGGCCLRPESCARRNGSEFTL